jgi:hypothetical protein
MNKYPTNKILFSFYRKQVLNHYSLIINLLTTYFKNQNTES